MEDDDRYRGRDRTVRSTMKELIKTKEELDRAKDEATQSWLDSKPLIDELEKLQSGVDAAKNRGEKAGEEISELQSEVEAIHRRVRSKMEEEVKAMKATNELTQAVDQTCKDLEAIKIEADEQRRDRLKLKQVLRMRRQSLRALQLKLRAVRIEAEAFATSAGDAAAIITMSDEADGENGSGVELTAEEYDAMARRAQEETALCRWRVSVSMEQKLAAEASRNVALARLKQAYSNSTNSNKVNGRKSSRRSASATAARWEDEEEDAIVEDEGDLARIKGARKGEVEEEVAAGDSSGRVGGQIVIPKARARAMAEERRLPRPPARRRSASQESNGRKRVVKRRSKPSIFAKFSNFIRGIKKWFR